MTARPIFPESRRRPLCTAVALVLVMVAVLLAAGCIGADYSSDQDIHLIKLNQDGSVAWTKLIDSGKDDEVNDVIQTSDGGYMVAGGYSIPKCNQHIHYPTTATLTRFSPEGDILWVQNYALNGKVLISSNPEQIIAVFQTPDSGFLTVSQFGVIQQLDNNGNIQWNRSISDKRALQLIMYSPLRTKDNGYILAGTAVSGDLTGEKNYTMMVTKLGQNTSQSWTNIYYDSNIPIINSLIELENNSGLVGYSLQSNGLVLFDNNGTILGYPEITTNSKFDHIYKIQTVPHGFNAYIRNIGNLVEELRFNNEGKLTGNRTLFNITHSNTIDSPGSDETLLTKDQGYLTIDSGTNSARARLMTPNGSVIWDKEIISYKALHPPVTHVRRIIETDDGGFLVVFGIEKATGC